MRRELYIPPQSIKEGLIPERAGVAFSLRFPLVIPEQPYLGQVYQLASLSLILTHSVTLKEGQEEAFPVPIQRSLQLLRNSMVVGVWNIDFQMRLVPGTEGKKWIGEATVYQDLTNPIDYRSGDSLYFAVAGVVPGNIGGPQIDKQEQREIEREEREITELAQTQQMLEQIIDLGNANEQTWTLLEEIRNRLLEME